jgi:hypothetical protein
MILFSTGLTSNKVQKNDDQSHCRRHISNYMKSGTPASNHSRCSYHPYNNTYNRSSIAENPHSDQLSRTKRQAARCKSAPDHRLEHIGIVSPC